MSEAGDVRDNAEASRYELQTDDGIAIAAYARDGDVLVLTHTEVPAELQGHGLATRLIEGALDDVRNRQLKIVPQCPFVAAYVDQHPDVQDLVAR